ncbi:MAG: tRNA 4-thiouridine(8) synthase ThiI [Oscillibacter sp.]|nr:tRNA 4-thiouridine(8) synthase ThiI [Oscillibacter sp.]
MNNNEMLLLKLGEVVLKGLNRRSFEDKLVKTVRHRMKACGSFQVYVRQSTIYVEPQKDDCDMEAAYKAAKQIFGVVTIARAVPCEKDIGAIVETAKTYLADEFAAAKTFKVESKRADKNFYLNSIQISQSVGGELAEAFPHVAVDVHKPDLTVYVEIREKHAYVHAPSVAGAGGLPVGTGGRAVSLLSGGLDSPVSSWMIARRGVELEMVHFVSPPYTSQQAQDKVIQLAQELTPYCGRMLIHVIPFTKIQEEIRRNCPEEYFTLIMRRFMMRISEAVAKKAGAHALVTGESLGQVASQTMMALGVTEDVTTMPILRPLIGTDKVEIIRLAREIGTYETSILPYEDCCTVFTPRHPAIRPNVEDVRAAEAALDVDALVAEALENQSWVRVKPQ